MSTLCHLHEDNEAEHWTDTPVGVHTLAGGHRTGVVIPADRECALRNITDLTRIVDVAEVTL